MPRRTLVLVLDVHFPRNLELNPDGDPNEGDSLVANAADYYINTLKEADEKHAEKFGGPRYMVKTGTLYTKGQFRADVDAALNEYDGTPPTDDAIRSQCEKLAHQLRNGSIAAARLLEEDLFFMLEQRLDKEPEDA